MADRSVSVFLKANVAGYLAAIEKAKLQTKDFAKDAAQSAKVHGESWSKVGKTMLLTGGAIAAGIGYAVKQFADFDSQMAQVKSLSGATAGEMNNLREAAMKTGTAFGFSAKQSAEAEIELVKAGLSVADIMGGALQGALTLAADGQMNVADATSIAAAAMVQFGKSGKDVPHIADLLAAGADKALGSVGDLGQALTSSGTVAAQWGLTMEQTVGTLSEFAAAGQTGERGGTLLRQMLLQLTNASGPAKKIMDQYGFSVKTAGGGLADTSEIAGRLQKSFGGLDKATQTHALAVIFGTHAIQGANILLKDGAKVNADWADKVNDAGFAATQAAGKMDSLKGDVQKLGAAFQNDLIESGSQANGALRALAQTGTGVLTTFGQMPAPVQKAGVGLAAVASSALLVGGAVTFTLPKIAEAQMALANMGKAGGLMSKGLSGAANVLTGPWGVGLAAGVVALGYFAKKQEDAREYVRNLTSSLNQQTGAITKNTGAMVYKSLVDSGAVASAKKLGISLEDLTTAALNPQSSAFLRVNAQLQAYINNQGKSEAGNRTGATEAKKMANSASELQKAIGGQNSAVRKAVSAFQDAKDAGVALDGATDSLTGSTKAFGRAASVAAGQVSRLQAAVRNYVAQAQKAKGIGVGVYANSGDGHAAGGYISGPGTGTSDSIPAMLSNGEFVINAKSVAAIGVANLHAMNRYAAGGMAGYAPVPVQASGGMPSTMILQVGDMQFTAYVRAQAAGVTASAINRQGDRVRAVPR